MSLYIRISCAITTAVLVTAVAASAAGFSVLNPCIDAVVRWVTQAPTGARGAQGETIDTLIEESASVQTEDEYTWIVTQAVKRGIDVDVSSKYVCSITIRKDAALKYAAAIAGCLSGCIIFSGLSLLSKLSRGARDQNTYCGKCGYNLRGIMEARCPECGLHL